MSPRAPSPEPPVCDQCGHHADMHTLDLDGGCTFHYCLCPEYTPVSPLVTRVLVTPEMAADWLASPPPPSSS